ncbi:MAG: hypothetical protein L0177_09350 [Chloroflexi bacterium]|nr:hypothetical protein [Chloroflexota bacterium]
MLTSDKQRLRKQIIALARKRQRYGTGSSPAVLRERTARMQFHNLSSVQGPIPWAVTGAVATWLYMPERFTRDLDVVMLSEDAEAVRQRLSEAGFEYQGELSIGSSSWLSPDDTPVDVIEMAAPWLPQALSEARQNLDAQGLPVLPFRYLVMMKFLAGRVQDLADITRMLGQASDDMLSSVRELFTQYLPGEMEDLESLIELGRLELGPSEA